MENTEDKELNPAKTLPIYSAVRKLVYITDDVMHEMDKDRRHTLGQKMFNLSLQLLEYVVVANNNIDNRSSTLREFVDIYDLLCVLYKMCTEKKYITDKAYMEVIPILSNIGKQSKGWLKKSLADKSVKIQN